MDRGFTERDGRAEMILKEVISIHRDMERETKQKDDKAEQVVNGQVDPWLKLSLDCAKELKGMTLQLYQPPSMKKRLEQRKSPVSIIFLFIFLSLCKLWNVTCILYIGSEFWPGP